MAKMNPSRRKVHANPFDALDMRRAADRYIAATARRMLEKAGNPTDIDIIADAIRAARLRLRVLSVRSDENIPLDKLTDIMREARIQERRVVESGQDTGLRLGPVQ